MTIYYAYEPEYYPAGWWDDSGRTAVAWFDQDLVEDPPLTLAILTAGIFLDSDTIFQVPRITVEVFASLYLDPDLMFVPASARALGAPDQMLKNEVRRVR